VTRWSKYKNRQFKNMSMKTLNRLLANRRLQIHSLLNGKINSFGETNMWICVVMIILLGKWNKDWHINTPRNTYRAPESDSATRLQFLGNIFFTHRNMYTAHERRYIKKLVDIHDNYYKMTAGEIRDVLYK